MNTKAHLQIGVFQLTLCEVEQAKVIDRLVRKHWSGERCLLCDLFLKKEISLISGRRGCAEVEFFGIRKDAACERSRPIKPCCETPDLCASATSSSPQTLIIFTVTARRLFAQLFYSGFYCNEANYPIAMLCPEKAPFARRDVQRCTLLPAGAQKKKKSSLLP